jgi:hypothetical protein
MSKRLHINYPLFVSDLNETSVFPTDFRRKAQMSSLIEIRLVEADFFHADGQTDGLTCQS